MLKAQYTFVIPRSIIIPQQEKTSILPKIYLEFISTKWDGKWKKALWFNLKNSKKKNQKTFLFHCQKDWNFCEEILQGAAILDKKLKLFICIYFNFNNSFA